MISRATILTHAMMMAVCCVVAASAQQYSEPPIPADTAGFIPRDLSYDRSRINVSIDYPEITRLPAASRRTLNRMIHDHARAQFREYRDLLLQSGREIEDVSGLSATRTARVWIIDSLVSVLYAWDVYSGGAHPGGFYESDIYLAAPGGVRTLALDDLFRRESHYDSVLADLITTDVLRRDPDSVWSDGELLRAALMESGLGSFALTREGILFATWPGPHVVGPIEVLVPYGSVAAYIDPRGPLGRFATAGSGG